MNCQEFKENSITWSRRRTPQSATQHAANCAACAAQLRQMQSLTKGLTAVREADAMRGASLATENALRAAFRAQVENQPAAKSKQPVTATPIALSDSNAPSRKIWSSDSRRVWWGRAGALAAGLALCVTTYGVWRSGAAGTPTPIAATVTALPQVLRAINLAEIEISAPAPRESRSASAPTALAQMRRSPARAQAVVTQTAKLTRPVVAVKAQPKKAAPPEVFTNHPREVVTEYFSLNNAPTLQATDEVQIVRVKLPRSAMAAFGLPVNENRAAEQVTADVVLGTDGVARAIRFVR